MISLWKVFSGIFCFLLLVTSTLDGYLENNSNLSLNQCLNCGDDYQLIFTVPKKNIQSLAIKMKKMKFEIYQVGTSIKTKKIYLDGKITSLNKGYKHF